ncbi:MAG: serine/threonine-protein kinase [Streptosporangiaceae bacterium]
MSKLIGGRYRLSGELGHGSAGSVWRALDVTLDREVVVREIPVREEWMREARVSARLSHPGVVSILDVIEQESRLWIVMEYIRAASLQEIIDRDGPIAPRRVAEIGRQVLEALRAGHRKGIVHRDVRPSNVLITPEDRVVLLDFGLPPVEEPRDGSGYWPPEVVTGEPAGPASDLWSLGATLYAAVEGRAPNEPGRLPRNAGPLTGVLEGLLVREPALRMTGDQALPLLTDLSDAPPRTAHPGKETQWDAAVVFQATGDPDFEPVNWNLPVSRHKKHRHDPYILKTTTRQPVPPEPEPEPERRSPLRAFADGFGGVFGAVGHRSEPLPPFEATLADDVHELCVALGLTADSERFRE